jgi:hypothetical protein
MRLVANGRAFIKKKKKIMKLMLQSRKTEEKKRKDVGKFEFAEKMNSLSFNVK